MSTVREALAAQQFYIAVQPIVDLRKKDIFGYEALLRSHSPEWKNPLQVLKAAQDEGVLGELGRACRDMALRGSPAHNVFLNLHPNEFDEGWLVRPDDPIFSHDRDVYLEITESVPLSHFRLCHTILREVRGKSGIFLAVDDLGAGYSNLKYIVDLSPEVVKLDRELVAGMVKHSRAHKLVSSLVKLCADLGAKVVAEGIETLDELHAVMDTGAHYAQGYLIARPAFPAPTVNWADLKL
jgi:EAL domain-containing protein (putative c-di-GMP-specific phosphodiesterase class I)